jgi:hypothetical protein
MRLSHCLAREGSASEESNRHLARIDLPGGQSLNVSNRQRQDYMLQIIYVVPDERIARYWPLAQVSCRTNMDETDQ